MTINVEWRNRMRQLELERIDPSWRKPVQPEQVIVFTKAAPISETMKRLYFNAGRYAAGNRDAVATKAHAKLAKKGEA